MKELSQESILDITIAEEIDLSPYDSNYPSVLLSNGLRSKLIEAKNIAQNIYDSIIFQSPIASQLKQATKKDFRLVVDVGDKTLKAIEKGTIKLSVEKSGKTFAQIRQLDGKFGQKLPIKKEYFSNRIDPAQMANALQMQAIEEQLNDITDQIQVINHMVERILEGQQTDRIAQYYTGVMLYTEAQQVSDLDMRKALISQSLRSLTEGTLELTLKMQSDINHLSNRGNKQIKGKRIDYIDEHMQSINQCFAYIHQASLLRAAIYCNQGELSAMACVLDEYSRFINNTIAKNAVLLSQCDIRDDGTKEGIWRARANLQLDVSKITMGLKNPNKTIYLNAYEGMDNE